MVQAGVSGGRILGLWTFDVPSHHRARVRAPGPHLFHLLVKGRYRLELGGEVFDVQQGDAIWYADGEAVRFVGQRSAVRFWSCRFVADDLVAPDIASRAWPADEGFRAAFRRLIEEDGSDAGAPWRRQANLAELIAAAVQAHPEPQVRPWDRIEAWVLRHEAFSLNADALAARHGLSRASLDRRCREVHGVGPGRRLRQLRLQRAIDIMVQTSLPIHEVAARLGYRDGAEFARACRRDKGLSPSQLRH